VIVGEELAGGSVVLRDLDSGEQEEAKLDDVPGKLSGS
jgi:histidyl-tRNA synthetase